MYPTESFNTGEGRATGKGSVIMDRLFSKFQLGDIKVGEETNFPPDAEPYGEQQAVAQTPAVAEDQLTEQRPASASERTYRPGYGQGLPEKRGEILKVSSRSRPSAVAGAIAGVVRESGRAEVQAIGAGAANQAIKAVAIARDYLIETGIEAICLPSLIDLQIDDADRTAIRLVVETR
jgi:stage V sporulation protein S